MPNWCSTAFVFHGSKEEVELLNAKINEWTSKSFIKTGFGDPWLGNVLIGAGLKDRIDNFDQNLALRCRGSITDISDVEQAGDNYSFRIDTETAWVPMAKMWEAVINVLNLSTVWFTFCAEECGCEIYWIYDPRNYGDFAVDQVHIDSYGNDELEELDGYYTTDDAIKKLNKLFGTDIDNIDGFQRLCEEYEDDHEDCFIGVHVFERDDEMQD